MPKMSRAFFQLRKTVGQRRPAMADQQSKPGDRSGQNQKANCFMKLVQEEF